MDKQRFGMWAFAAIGVMAAIATGISMILTKKTEPLPVSVPIHEVPKQTQSGAHETIYLYFLSKNEHKLVAESRVVDHLDDPSLFATEIVEALLAGPHGENISAIPDGTRCRGVYLTDSAMAVVDMSPEIRDHHPGSVESELATIYSIVNSLVLNMPEVNSVQILVNGKNADTLAGQVDIRNSFTANMMMIK